MALRHPGRVSLAPLSDWIATELIASGLSPDEADRAVAALTDPRVSGVGTAATLVTTARGVARLPEGAAWWATEEARLAKERLLAGEPDYAWAAVGERLAEPAEDCWDPNWPAHKAAWALLRDDAHAGDSYVVGNGYGGRARVEIVEQDGVLSAVITESWSALGDVWDVALMEARGRLGGEA